MVFFVAHEFEDVADVNDLGGGPYCGDNSDVSERGEIGKAIVCGAGMCERGGGGVSLRLGLRGSDRWLIIGYQRVCSRDVCVWGGG